MKFKLLLIIFPFILLLAACDLINPPEPIPARIQLNELNIHVDPGQGTSRHKITEVWTIANNDLIGAFTPPVEIPYITNEEMSNFRFRPGIRNNGILDDAIVYPMLTEYVVDLNTSPGTVSVVNPVIRYRPEVVFSLVSDFEVQNDFVDDRDTLVESRVVRSSVEPFEGSFSGEIILTPEIHFIEVGNAFPLGGIPTNGNPVYLEMHYKSEAEIAIGLLGVPLDGPPASNFFYLLRPSEEWNKIYIELTEQVVLSDLPAYKILFRARFPPSSTQPSVRIQLDNIKVVHIPE